MSHISNLDAVPDCDKSALSMQISTLQIHHPYQPPAGFAAVPAPVHKASTVIFANVAAMRERNWAHKGGYTYGLHGTPTTFTLEARIATLEGGAFCTLAPSGLAAVALADMAFLQAGDELLIPDNAYGPGKALAAGELAGWGITHRFYDAMQPGDLAAKLSPATRLVWLEAPGSVTLEFPDIPALTALIKAHNAGTNEQRHRNGCISVLDNTWGAGIAFNAFELGADVSVQALTKYPSGGGDVLMGSVVTQSEALHQQIHACHMRTGLGIAANDAELVLRGLQTMALRYAAQDAATRTLATWMQQHSSVACVLHPALPDSPGHATWQRDCTGAACLFSVVFDSQFTSLEIDRFCDSLRLFKLGYSWAGPMSLCVPYDMPTLRSVVAWPHAGVLVRFSIGLEAVEDLKADLLQALSHLE